MSGILVQSGVGFRGARDVRREVQGAFPGTPIVRVTAEDDDGRVVTIDMGPREARRIGLDFLSAAVQSVSEVGIRAKARTSGIDGDEVILWMRHAIDAMLKAEEST